LTTPPTVAANAILVLELFTPDGRAPANNQFFIGSNALGQSAPCYILAADCGITTPTTLAAVGFPNMHLILNAAGLVSNPASSITQIAGIASGGVFPVGVTTNTFRVTDGAGLTATCSMTVTVVDNQAPVVTCPVNIPAQTDANQCYATVVTPNPTVSDNCAVTLVTWKITDPAGNITNSPATGINYVGTQQFLLNGTTGSGVSTILYTVKDAAGNTTTCSYTVTVTDASIPVITGQPTNQFVCTGSNGTFSVTANAGAAGNPLTYKWQTWNGSAWVDMVPAQTASTLTLTAVQFSQNTSDYRVILTGRCSVVTSGFATLYVNPLPSISLLASGLLSLLPGQSVDLTAVVSPVGGTYQWFKNGSTTVYSTASALTGLTVDDIGSYTCTYTDLNGCKKTSETKTISGQPSDRIWLYPNPNTGIFQVRFFNTVNENVTVNIFDFGGRKVYTKLVTTGLNYSGIEVNVSYLPADIYLVRIVNSAGRIIGSKKVIIHRQP
jgi:Secretion system C-terminal sorting domain/HYR domain